MFRLTPEEWACGGWALSRRRELTITAAGVFASLASLGVGLLLWLRSVPPWLLTERYGSADIKRVAWDERRRREEETARLGRRYLRLLLVRHGESAANTRPELIGGRDVQSPLTQKGEAQAKMLGERLRRECLEADRVITSHAVRAKMTAILACKAIGFPVDRIEEEPQMVEFSQGALERQVRTEVYRSDGPVKQGIVKEQMFFRPPGLSPDGERGESQHDVERRIAS
eukprot:CAMPEP_0203922172 /NCGR_PEP_ID=MMETSP0359-20131031/62234_1 /ASSEMBLY_ACC=CAM_ASM_000338 /TAXON_ID=268821 /ORGANISM="Scrippsiella Hangoei, Strain SHTV-5" /LENGTH=227 /DNA_ID=CAMNT_0050849995 /DNA_START=43 /DNA_END=722 /DNA_ORIENTATION=+